MRTMEEMNNQTKGEAMEKTKRKPSAATLRTRAFGRMERLRQKIDDAKSRAAETASNYAATLKKLDAEHMAAKAEFEALGKAAPEA